MSRLATLAAVTVALIVVPCGSALAADVRLSQVLEFRASPGEVNHVTISEIGGGYRVEDTGAVLAAGYGCDAVSAHIAECAGATHVVAFELGDGDKIATNETSTHAIFTGGSGK
jgi:hypothetical protein